MDPKWREDFEQLEQRIQRHLDTLRERSEQMMQVIQDAERRRSLQGGSTQR